MVYPILQISAQGCEARFGKSRGLPSSDREIPAFDTVHSGFYDARGMNAVQNSLEDAFCGFFW